MEKITLTSWNAYSTRFVRAPHFTWKSQAGAKAYRIVVADLRGVIGTFETPEPEFDFSDIWADLPNHPLDILIQALGENAAEVCAALPKRLHKVPGFDGVKQVPLDWNQAVQRNMAYLLGAATDAIKDYEKGLPRSCWSSYEESTTGKRYHFSYPALHHPSFILCYLEYARLHPESPFALEASRQARQYADWLLENRHPRTAACPLFPYSTIHEGELEGGAEGRSITLFRAARVGESMIAMHRASGDQRFLDYASHLGDVLQKMQRPDGSWPYRVDPVTGNVTDEYTSNTATPARFFGMLSQIVQNADLEHSRKKAAQWMLTHPVKTKLWQGMYEDVRSMSPYRNLENWDTNEAIRYLLYFASETPGSKDIAKNLNEFIEDQFVVWQDEDSPVTVKCPTPTVLEQYACYYPMEIHTANWLLSLMELHRSTGEENYLVRAVAAANSIVRGQQTNGAFSTWGHDLRFGRPLITRDWPGCNAYAATALLKFAEYHSDIQNGRPNTPDLIGA